MLISCSGSSGDPYTNPSRCCDKYFCTWGSRFTYYPYIRTTVHRCVWGWPFTEGPYNFPERQSSPLQSLRELQTRCSTDPTSNIILAITRVPENSLHLIFSTIHSFGLPSWHPDLLGGTSTSIYNGALENIALWTFEQAASSFAYAHLSPTCAIFTTRHSYKSFTKTSFGHTLRAWHWKNKRSWAVLTGQYRKKRHTSRGWRYVILFSTELKFWLLMFNSLQNNKLSGWRIKDGMSAYSSWLRCWVYIWPRVKPRRTGIPDHAQARSQPPHHWLFP